ncbi:MAG: hypothetical protein KHY19_05800 [Coprobacillus cateniformis]|nr:hypothetical protein [Coprobacillus cateniformis]
MEEKWVCTDLDSSQYRKINADSTYIFIEKVWLDICEGDEGYPDKEYTVKSAWIDLNDYSDYEKECAISGYYESMNDIYDQHIVYLYYIIELFIFEDMNVCSATTYGMMTEKEADEFIQKYITR